MGARRCDGAFGFVSQEDRAYAINTVETVTWLAGRPDYFDELGEAGKDHDLFGSISRSRSSRVFDWLMAVRSLQLPLSIRELALCRVADLTSAPLPSTAPRRTAMARATR